MNPACFALSLFAPHADVKTLPVMLWMDAH
jgi:carboxylesterase type B